MYESFFQLKQKPFELTPNPVFLYLSESYRKAMTYLEYGLKDRTGFMVLTGEVGSGKTTLIRHLIKGLDAGTSLSKVFNTKVDAQQLIAMICEDYGLDVAGKDKIQLLRDLNDFLIKEYQQQRRALLIIDEAQNLTPDLLEEVRMLSNLETDDSKLLQILLVGQTELASTLQLPELRQLRQRISIVCKLNSLNRQEVEEYILHRMEIAGNRSALQIAPEAMDAIYAYSSGIPRLVNIVCGFSLLTAFTEDSHVVNAEMAADIIKSLGPVVAISQPVSVKPQAEGQAGKLALLKALGDAPPAQAVTSQAGVRSQWNLRMMLKDLDLRIAAVEKECDSLPLSEIDGLRQRITNLEKAYVVLKQQFDKDRLNAQTPVLRGATAAVEVPRPAERKVFEKESGISKLITAGKTTQGDRGSK